MTTRRFNYTGCQRILRRDVEIELDGTETPPSFNLDYDLGSYDFPAAAQVVIEAQAHWTVMRFLVGTIEHPLPSEAYVLTDFESGEGIRFRVKVVGVGEDVGRILGEADGLRPAKSSGVEASQSFLAVQPAALGHVIWQLSFAGTEPLLQVNDRLADWRSFMRRSEVRALILPEVYRRMLDEALDNPADDGASEAWQNAVISTVPVGVGPAPVEGDDDDRDSWITAAVGRFAARHKLLNDVASWGVDET